METKKLIIRQTYYIRLQYGTNLVSTLIHTASAGSPVMTTSLWGQLDLGTLL